MAQEPTSKYGTIGLPQGGSKYGTIGLESDPRPDVSVGEYGRAAGASFIQGATGMIGGAISGLGRMAEAIDPYFPESMRSKGGLVAAGKSVSQIGGELGQRSLAKVRARGGAGEFMATDVPQALGSSAGALALGGGIGGALGRASAIAGVGAASVGAQASEGYEDAIAAGADPETARKSAVLNAPTGLLEVVPGLGVEAKVIRRIAGRMSSPAGKVLKTALLDMPGEALTESVQTTIGNLVASENGLDYEDRALFEGVLRSGSAGGLAAFITSALGGTAQRVREARMARSLTGQPVPQAKPQEPGAAPAGAPADSRTAIEDRMAQDLTGRPVPVAGPTSDNVPRGTEAPAVSPEARALRTDIPPEVYAPIAQGRQARAVQPAGPEDTFLAEVADQRGTDLVLVEAEDGKPLPLPAMYSEGRIVLDANAAPGTGRRALVYHELLHGLRDRAGETWDTLFASVERLDPEGLAAAAEGYAADFERATGAPLPEAKRAEEGLSRRAEVLGGWLDAAVQDPERFGAILDGDRTFRERLRDALARFMARFGVRFDTVLQKRLRELERDLGKPPSGDPQQAAELAYRFASAINSLVGTELQPAPAGTEPQPAQTGTEPQPAPTGQEQGTAATVPGPVPGGATADGKTGAAVPPAEPSRASRDALDVAQPESGLKRSEAVPEAEKRSDFEAAAWKAVAEVREVLDGGPLPPIRPLDERRSSRLLLDQPLPKLKAMLKANLADESARAGEVLARELGYSPPQVTAFAELRRKARDPNNPEQAEAAKQIAAVKAKIRPRALRALDARPASGFYTEDVLRALGVAEAKQKLERSPEPKRRGLQARKRADTTDFQEQIAEAENVLGTDVRFAVAPRAVTTTSTGTKSFDLPETRRDAFLRTVQDSLVRPKRIGGATDTKADFTEDADALGGRAKERIKRARKMGMARVRALLRQHKISLSELGEYLYALHAPDANALAKRRHPRKFGFESNPGSGMSNSDAAEIIAKVNADPRAIGFKELAGVMRQIGRAKLDTLVEYGLLSKEERAQWEKELGPNYVSLRDVPTTPALFSGRRKGFGARGKESKRREGRRSPAELEGIVADTIGQYEAAIVRGEHNRVGQAFGEWVKALNDPSIAEFATVEMPDADDVLQDVARKPKIEDGEALFEYKEKGHPVYVIIRDSAKDRRGQPLLARAISRVGVVGGTDLFRSVVTLMSFVGLARTAWNAEFLISNTQVDLLDATVTLQREGKAIARKVWRNMPRAIAATWNAAHDKGKRVEWSDLYDQAAEDGAFTGYHDYKSTQDILDELKGLLDGDSLKDKGKAALEWISQSTGAFEEATRLSIYNAAIESGKSRREAARIARETTTPFMRKGEAGTLIGMFYLFANAAIQSQAIAYRLIKTPRGRKALGILAGASFIASELTRLLMGQDDDGEDRYSKSSDWATRMDFLEFGVPGTDKTLKWRASRTYRPFHVFGAGLSALMHGDITPEQFGSALLRATIEAGVPLDTSSSFLQSISPTLLHPAVQVATNTGYRDRPINPEYPNDARPDSEQAFSTASSSSRAIARALNSLTGGDSVKEGLLSIKPGTIDTYMRFIGGGVGSFGGRIMDTVERVAKGQELYADDFPLVRRLLSGENKRQESTPFYDTVRKVDELVDRVRAYREAGEPDKARAEIQDNMDLWRLRLVARSRDKLVRELRVKAAALPDGPKRKQIEDRIDAIMESFNDRARKP